MNRYQCCPLYVVKYRQGSYTARVNSDSAVYVTSRKYFPPVGWTSSSNYYVTPARVQKAWPFYAKTIFDKMDASVVTVAKKKDRKTLHLCDTAADEKKDKKTEASVDTAAEKKTDTTKKKTTTKLPLGLSSKLQSLNDMGFYDRDENIEVLRKFKCNLEKSVSYLLNQKEKAPELNLKKKNYF